MTFLTVAQHGLIGDMRSPVDLTYLSDCLILMRFYEFRGRLNRAVSVVKKRSGYHRPEIHAFSIGAGGIAVGEPMSQFDSVLHGRPWSLGVPDVSRLDTEPNV